jgi:hypothetical protein
MANDTVKLPRDLTRDEMAALSNARHQAAQRQQQRQQRQGA